jgi:type II secretory pathway pseudopilin PulG
MKKEGVVWISTILYTMISLAIIGLLLSVIQPKISQVRDSIIIDQTKASLTKIDAIVLDVTGGTNSKQYSEFRLGKGNIIISGPNNSISWVYDAKYKYSEVNRTIRYASSIYETTDQIGDMYRITLKLNYSDIDLRYNDQETDKILQAGSIPYKLWFENKGPYIDVTVE